MNKWFLECVLCRRLWHHLCLFRDDLRDLQLNLTAASLAFSTALAIVPVFVIIFTIFTFLPTFNDVYRTVEEFLTKNVLEGTVVKNTLQYLVLFSQKARKLSFINALFLIATVWVMLATTEKVFNRIWRAPSSRSFFQRLVLFWGLVTLLPLLFGLVLWVSDSLFDYLDWVKPGKNSWLSHLVSTALFSGFCAIFYLWLPNTVVKARHAWGGALVAGVVIELTRSLFFYYLLSQMSYTMVYGALAAIPVLLIWFYLFWWGVLLGAVISAYLASPHSLSGQLGEHA